MTASRKKNKRLTLIELVFKSGSPVSFYTTSLADLERDVIHILNWRAKHLKEDSLDSISSINFEDCENLNIPEEELKSYINNCLIKYESEKYGN